ncbi:hypothetical protein GCG54_00014430 [Colletotrichum gloeosporioides]|uniref:C2H2-type domain-containing protein n=1 Tax=Colletotrichum gloeosporioides TaxID=474922 RepID=A0A8H4FRA2_COLGL|nr:uncharacterized protein GCG54_00014430 [Colletotrichum gloeosporioides]KAF3811683.1 hypothetical protein GCG54_00014430 [Colletotrichum gloeosporioides]
MHDDNEAAVEGAASTTGPRDPINLGKSVEALQRLALHRRKPQIDDNRSVGTISTSYSKDHSTTFSAPNLDLHMHSPPATTPTTSRHQSPTRLTFAPSHAMELGLVGIGDHVKALPLGKFTADLPILSRDPHIPESQLSRDDSSTPKQPAPSTDMNITTEASISSEESESDSEMSRSDLDLERAASIALSRCFGVGLNRLSRPVRVIEAFSEFKDQCAEILREEESFSTIDWDDDGFSCYDVEEGADSYGNPTYDKTSNRAQQSEPRTNKRPAEDQGGDDGDDEVEQDPDQDQGPTKKGGNKRRRIGCQEHFSCPFRKRNPWRFNARDFDACANRSYKNMGDLKIHIRAEHGKQSCVYCGQPRMGEDHPPEVCLRNRQSKASPDPKTPDPEDGVDSRKDKSLRSRTSNCKIQTWHQLWKLLFPDDEEIPSHTFDPVIEHHDIAVLGCKRFVLKTAEDVMGLVHQRLGLSVQAQIGVSALQQSLEELIHKRTKDLLQGSRYADYERYRIGEASDMVQIPTPTKGKCVVPVMHNQIGTVLEDGDSPGVIVMRQPSPPGADTMLNNTSAGPKASSSAIRERLIAPKTGQALPPNTSQEIYPAPGAFMHNGSSSTSGGHQVVSLPDLQAGNDFNWADTDAQNWQGFSEDDFVDMGFGNMTTGGFFNIPSMNPDSGADYQPFGGSGNDASA